MQAVWTYNNHNSFLLLPERAMLWQQKQILIITDPHFGKGASMRANGFAVPTGSSEADVQRLDDLLTTHEPSKLIILGDFFHHKTSQEEYICNSISIMRQKHVDVEMILIRGNHDRHAGDPPPQCGIQCIDEAFFIDQFAFCHYPQSITNHFVFSGHIHPGIKLREPGQKAIYVPCFHFEANFAILPAFGSLTGLQQVQKNGKGTDFIIVDSDIYKI